MSQKVDIWFQRFVSFFREVWMLEIREQTAGGCWTEYALNAGGFYSLR